MSFPYPALAGRPLSVTCIPETTRVPCAPAAGPPCSRLEAPGVPYTGNKLEPAWRQLAKELAIEAQHFEDTLVAIEGVAADATADLDRVCAELAAVYLPELTPEALAEAERLTGFRGFSRFNPIQAMHKENGVLASQIAAIEADPSYVRREYLVGPNGSITRELAEAADNLATWQLDCDRFESLDGFLDLVESKYDTPEFAHRWWTPAYWRRWSAGDRICRDLALHDFGDDVLPAYRKASVPRDQWRGEVARVTAARDAVLGRVQTRDLAVLRKQNLREIYLEECRKALAAHVGTADPQLLHQWSGGDRGLLVLLQQLSGGKAKLEYTRDMRTQLGADLGALRERSDQAMQKAAKFARPKKQRLRFPDSAYPSKGLASVPKLRARREKALAIAQRIRGYDDYHAFDLDNDPALWWYAMTRRAPGSYNPGLQGWYDRHPDPTIVWIEEPRDEHLHATALADADGGHDALGDLS
jgi:hypothetical protein